MDPVVISLLSAIVGALIGSITSIAGIVLQSRREERRHRREVASQFALEEWKTNHGRLEKSGGKLLPASAYFAYYLQLLDAAEDGPITPERWRSVSRDFAKLVDAIFEADAERVQAAKARS